MKPEVVFGLEGAAWPALLVNASGRVLRGNATALAMFGPALGGDAPQLALIWSPENGGSAVQFLLLWEHAPTAGAGVKVRGANWAAGKIHEVLWGFLCDGNK